jgi:hypothetical protein
VCCRRHRSNLFFNILCRRHHSVVRTMCSYLYRCLADTHLWSWTPPWRSTGRTSSAAGVFVLTFELGFALNSFTLFRCAWICCEDRSLLITHAAACDSLTHFRCTQICSGNGSVLITSTTASHRQLADRQMHLARFLRSLLRYKIVTLHLLLLHWRSTGVHINCSSFVTTFLRQDRRRVRRGGGDHKPSGGDR